MNDVQVASVKACDGIYRASDVARHFGVHRSTVGRIWRNELHADVSPASDFPDIHTRLYGDYLRQAICELLQRGMKPKEVAQELEVTERTVYMVKGVFV